MSVSEEHLREAHGVTDGFAKLFMPGATDAQWGAWHEQQHVSEDRAFDSWARHRGALSIHDHPPISLDSDPELTDDDDYGGCGRWALEVMLLWAVVIGGIAALVVLLR